MVLSEPQTILSKKKNIYFSTSILASKLSWHWFIYDLLQALHRLRQSHREGGQGGTMTPEPMDFGRPMGFMKAVGFSEMTLRNQHVKPEDLFFEDHLISTGKTVRISVKTFFFSLEITSVFGPNYSIFSVYFGLHETEIRHTWAGPGPTFGPRRPCFAV